MSVKRIIILIVALIIVLAGIFAAWFFIIKDQAVQGEPDRAVPFSAIMVLKTNDLKGQLTDARGTLFWQSLKENTQVKKLEEDIIVLDSIFAVSPEIKLPWKGERITLSLHATSLKTIDLLAIFHQAKGMRARDLDAFMNKHLEHATFSTHSFEEVTINEVVMRTGRKFAYATFRGMVAVSTSSLLVEDAVRSHNSNQPEQVQFYEHLKSFQNDHEFVINFDRLQGLLTPYVNTKTQQNLDGISSFGGLGRYDFSLKEDLMTLYGNIMDHDSTDLLAAMKGQEPGSAVLTALLPVRTAFFELFALSDFPAFHEKRLAGTAKAERWTDFNRRYDLELADSLFPYLNGEFVLAITEPSAEDFSPDVIGAVQTTDAAQARRQLRIASQDRSAEPHEVYRDYEIRRNLSPLPSQLFGESWQPLDSSFYTFHGNTLLLATTLNNLQRWLDELQAGQTLTKNSAYFRFSGNVLVNCNYYLFLNSSRSLMLPARFLNIETWSNYFDIFPALSNFQFISFQISSGPGNFYNHISAGFGVADRGRSELAWKLKLDTALAKPPVLVLNHDNNSNEILANDVDGNLYLVSPSGTMLWKREFSNSYVGSVAQVDFYQNDKLQYLFTTDDQIQLLDRLGRDVANYPIRLSTVTRTGAAVFDPYNNGKYRFFVGCENNRIYGYYLDGKPVKGWDPRILDAPLAFPLQMATVDDEHLLYGITLSGTFYLFNLKGEQEMNPVATGISPITPPKLISGAKLAETEVITADTIGVAVRISFDGRVERQQYGKWEGPFYFDYHDIDSDGTAEYVYAQNTILKAFEQDSTPSIFITFPDSVSLPLQFLPVNGGLNIGYFSEKSGVVNITATDGIIAEGFPLPANTPFTTGNLIGGGENEIIMGQAPHFLVVYKIR